MAGSLAVDGRTAICQKLFTRFNHDVSLPDHSGQSDRCSVLPSESPYTRRSLSSIYHSLSDSGRLSGLGLFPSSHFCPSRPPRPVFVRTQVECVPSIAQTDWPNVCDAAKSAFVSVASSSPPRLQGRLSLNSNIISQLIHTLFSLLCKPSYSLYIQFSLIAVCRRIRLGGLTGLIVKRSEPHLRELAGLSVLTRLHPSPDMRCDATRARPADRSSANQTSSSMIN
ncbi:unnamed protein product [Protopolystoma xenopodis]|uniref:Uncharacterized protein n=1 Tax=Protopolystoma xenopodis TaxID=117903 RepID=A0A448XD13_9PLAT|nr:unnamed protein product [Protopolystoma xenopodis]